MLSIEGVRECPYFKDRLEQITLAFYGMPPKWDVLVEFVETNATGLKDELDRNGAVRAASVHHPRGDKDPYIEIYSSREHFDIYANVLAGDTSVLLPPPGFVFFLLHEYVHVADDLLIEEAHSILNGSNQFPHPVSSMVFRGHVDEHCARHSAMVEARAEFVTAWYAAPVIGKTDFSTLINKRFDKLKESVQKQLAKKIKYKITAITCAVTAVISLVGLIISGIGSTISYLHTLKYPDLSSLAYDTSSQVFTASTIGFITSIVIGALAFFRYIPVADSLDKVVNTKNELDRLIRSAMDSDPITAFKRHTEEFIRFVDGRIIALNEKLKG
jgi:hypothetical protein